MALLVLCTVASAARGQAPQGDGVALVRALYANYAWEATAQPVRGKRDLVAEPLERLEEFFESGLAALLRRDRECVERTRDVCKLGFSPLWASQDPGATNLVISQAAQAAVVQVQFTHPGSGQQLVLRFTVVAGKHGARIADIEYPRGERLRTLLSGPT